MRRHAPLLLAALALLPAARAVAQVDAVEYLPLGAFDAWELIDRAKWESPNQVKAALQRIDVVSAGVVGDALRYELHASQLGEEQDVGLLLGVADGELQLHGARLVDAGDLHAGAKDVPLIVFDEPAPLGDGSTPLDAPFATTAVSGRFEVTLVLGPQKLSGTVFVDATVTATWNAVAGTIDTPLGTFGDDETLAELVLDADFAFSSPDALIDAELSGVQVSKSVAAILAPGLGFVQVDGKAGKVKILNRAILPAQLVSNPLEPDAFPAPPPGDLAGLLLDIPDVVSLDDALGAEPEGGFGDGALALAGAHLDHALDGRLSLAARVTTAAGDGPFDLLLTGRVRHVAKAGVLKLRLSGRTRKLDQLEAQTTAKSVRFRVKQDLAAPFGPADVLLEWSAGKDPLTGEKVGGQVLLPVTPFVGTSASVVLALPVDLPTDSGALDVDPALRELGAEGELLLYPDGPGDPKAFPVVVREIAKLAAGQPVERRHDVLETGRTLRHLRAWTVGTGVEDLALLKLKGRLLGVKLAPDPADVLVGVQ